MAALSQSDIDNIGLDDVRVISCGVNPDDGFLYIITNQFDAFYVEANGNLQPHAATPYDSGKKVIIVFTNGSEYVVDSAILLSNSKNCLTNSSIFIGDSYLCNLSLETTDEIKS
jgi:hypothetical protein